MTLLTYLISSERNEEEERREDDFLREVLLKSPEAYEKIIENREQEEEIDWFTPTTPEDIAAIMDDLRELGV